MDSSMSRKSEAAATRKRRSSILKSQRAPRTPFSELEFHVATPTDVSKSRRVSFSRRNGVAEFEITEATTAWKNVYEEHNKSLETSTNDSSGKSEKNSGRRVDYLGCRIADIELQDVEPGEDPVIAEYTNNDKSLVAPNINCELTEFTEHQTNQLFDHDTNPMIREFTDQIDLNFSAVAPLSDDFNIQDGLYPEKKATNMSYIDIDLNATHFSLQGEVSGISDMSITDSIHSPKVAAAKVTSEDKALVVDNWVADKENIIVNPYVAPLPAENFAVSDDNDDVLVFDGKKCKFQSDIKNKVCLKPENSDKRRTIVYNSDQGDISVTQGINAQIIIDQGNNPGSRQSMNKTRNNDTNISMTQVVPSNILMCAQEQTKAEKERTIHFDDFADISMTQALPSNIFGQKLDERRKTILNENNEGRLSITEVVPANVIPAVEKLKKTILYENEDADISLTQTVPLNIQAEVPSDRGRTVVYEDETVDVTLAVPTNLIHEKRKTILFGNDSGNISMTQTIPANFIVSVKRESDKSKTIVNEDECGDLSVTQALPANLILSDKTNSDKRKTIVYEQNDGDMSVTDVVPDRAILQEIQDRLQVLRDKSVVDTSLAHAPLTNFESMDATNKRRSIVFNSSLANLSITQSLPENILVPDQLSEKGNTLIYQDEAADISDTKALPTNIMQKSNTDYDISLIKTESIDVVPDRNHEGHFSIVDTGPNEVKMENTRNSVVCDADKDVDMSITQAISNSDNNKSKRNTTTIVDDTLGNLSMTKPIPAQIMSIQSDIEVKCKNNRDLEGTYSAKNKSVIEPQDIFIYDAAVKYTKVENEHESDLATASDDVLETSSSKVSGSASDSSVSQKSGKIQVLDDPMESANDEQDVKPLVNGEDNTSAVSVIEKRISSSPRHEIEDNPVSIKDSILNDLLDMSESAIEDQRENKYSMIKLTSNPSSETATVNNDKRSEESYLLIKDSDEEQADKKSGINDEETHALECPKLLPIEYQEEKHHGIVGKLQHKLSELKTFINQKSMSKTKNVSKNFEPDKVNELEEIDKNETINRSIPKKANKTENNADDTNALLDMLSQFTDTRVSRDFAADNRNKVSPVKVKGLIAIENKSEEINARRSLVPDRKSMIRSREDLLKDIAMVQAMIKFDDEQNDQMDESAEDTMVETREEASPPRDSPHISHEVVKTLKFDEDESMLEPEMDSRQEIYTTRNEMATSPLKKTAFGETTYIEDHVRDSKTKVIPGFLKDVSNDLKALLSDLVKPINDPIPFDTNLAKKTASTHSTQIQANLLTSSQIDLDPDLQSNAHSAHSVEDRLASETPIIDKSIARALQSQIISPGSHLEIPESDSELSDPKRHDHHDRHVSSIRKVQDPRRVIVFDHRNPLNNVLLPAIDRGEVHKYNPGVPDSFESLDPEASETKREPVSEKEDQHVVESRMALHDSVLPAGEVGPPAIAKQSFMSDTSKPMSLDESIDAKQEVREVEVNTVIVMKGNKDLLEASSSLTLVDDALARSAYDVEIDSNSPQKKGRSPVQVIFKIKEPESSVKLDSDLTSNDGDLSEIQSKGKKRSYSPAQFDKHCTLATEEVTPKPASKVQKVSLISKTKKMLGIATKQHDRAAQAEVESSQDGSSSAESDAPSEDMGKSKKKPKNLGATITVQQLMTEYDMDVQIDQVAMNREILAHLTAKAAKSEASCSTIGPVTLSNTEDCKSLGVVSSFASSKMNFQSDPSDCEGLKSVASETLRAQWQPELMHEVSSKNLVTECESSVNVVSKIDVLPFMGTTDCEWESRSADCWTFRLLRARLRLVVRLQHRHGNAPRSRVRADTPVLLVAVEQPPLDNKKENPIATLCVNFAEEVMRYFVGRGCARAGCVPALLRRCAAAARVAVRWGRALHAARAHLAFSLTHDGALSLKVANIPLRSVWEVTMRLELVVSDAREAPWPRAGCVRAARVVGDTPVAAPELQRLLAAVPSDWGHAPRAIWKIFKYLKHKTRDDELLLGL